MMESENIKATATKAAAPRPAASATPAAPAENELKPAFFAPEDLRAEMERLRKEEGMDFLVNLTGVDWQEDGLGVVYQLESTVTHKQVCLKTATTDRENPLLPSVSDLWDVANIYEREVFDFYGVRFTGHPDMRRVFMREDWVGYPFRKDDETEKNNPLRMTNEPLADVTETLTLNADGTVTRSENRIFEKDEYVVNIGPQHPSTHGVLHFRVSLEGERIRKIDPILGYIHRAVEKISEDMTYPQTLALTDRLDYLGAMQNRHALCMTIEKAMGVEVSDRVKVIRTIMDELQRIDSHILFFSCLCQDLGATTAFLYGFRDREKILDIFEETCGGRLILNYNTIGGVMADIHPNFQKRVKEFIPYMRKNIQEYHDIFTGNVIFQNRSKGVGVLTKEQCISFGCTGGTGRAAGWHNDVRKLRPYAAYDRVRFNEVTRTEGDSFARYMVRMDEILESLDIIEQLIDNIPEGNFQEKMKPIIKVPAGTYYTSVEGSRGEFGVLLESKGDKTPYRLHYRSTGLPLVAAMDTACRNSMIADLITIGGTVDYVVPDIDR
ncbi:NADH-quinone oxidoreductase subunit C/D [Bacteroidaceae bacterium]|nr:NADH-quinone oxidoreductase subunit D [Prevotella sp. MGM2]GAY31306.1 bifunctional NADH:ubiquinone oxidoreductase subunit C/D [Prevotella sp. MGM2]GFI33583.1 NADH-quinone oxidoreductase subunit C/D [Bacteroidaceae bacterium]